MKQAILAEGVEIGKDHSGAHWAPKSLPEVVPLNSNYGPSFFLNFTSLFSRFYSANSNGLIQFSAIPSDFELPRFCYLYGISRSWETTTSVKMADTSYDIIGQVRVKTKPFCNKNACHVGQNCLHYGVYRKLS